MNVLRRSFRLHPRAAAWLLAATLLMKLLVPAGFMPVAGPGSIRIELCRGFEPEPMAMPSMHGQSGDQHEHHHGKAAMACDFSVLGSAGLATGDLPGLAGPLLVPAASIPPPLRDRQPSRVSWLRPPLRGPPTA